MPIDLITGLPGNGKTAFFMSELLAMEVKQEKRKIYICGIDIIKEFALDIEMITYGDIHNWKDFKSGSLIVIDEAQEIFPQRSASSKAPAYITDLSKHRHYGLDFILITQDPRLLDAWARRLIATHQHIKRLFGTAYQVAFEWDKVCDNPRERRDQSSATKKITKLNKKVYGTYKSSVEHTVKRRVPFIVYLVIGFILSFPVIGYVVYKNFALGDNVDREEAVSSDKKRIVSTPYNKTSIIPVVESDRFIDQDIIFTNAIRFKNTLIITLVLFDARYGSEIELGLDDLKLEKGLQYSLIGSNKLILKQGNTRKTLFRVNRKARVEKFVVKSDPLNGLKIPF